MGEQEIRSLALTLRKVDFFSDLSIADLDAILKCIQFYEFPPGSMIFKKGDPGDALYVIHEGQIEIFIKKLFSGKKSIDTLGQGHFFGEMALLNKKPRSASAAAVTNTKLFVLLKSDFLHVLRNNTSFAAEMKRISEQRKFHTKRIT